MLVRDNSNEEQRNLVLRLIAEGKCPCIEGGGKWVMGSDKTFKYTKPTPFQQMWCCYHDRMLCLFDHLTNKSPQPQLLDWWNEVVDSS